METQPIPTGNQDDAVLNGQGMNHHAIQAFPDLPPQMFTTAAHLLELTDTQEKVVLVMRDGRKLVGVLRSWDQYANLVFRDVAERFYDSTYKVWGEIPEQGTQIVRGENVVMLGEMDLDKEDHVPDHWTQVGTKQITDLRRQHQDHIQALGKRKKHASSRNGFEVESVGEVLI